MFDKLESLVDRLDTVCGIGSEPIPGFDERTK